MQVPGLSLSLADTGYACVSTIISVFMHELGHAVAATRSVVFAFIASLVKIETLLISTSVTVLGNLWVALIYCFLLKYKKETS